MNIIKNKKIAIIGGGPGGLTLARLLQMNGADVNVYERDMGKDARAQGATLDLHEESGLAALRQAGLMDAFTANYRPGADKLRIMDKNANIALDDHENAEKSWNRPEIDRGPLQQILLDSLKPDTVVWDSQFVSLSDKNGTWELQFKNGAIALADIVIGADGANSRIRPYLTPVKPFYSGITVIEGSVYHAETASPEVYRLLRGGKIFALGDSRTLIVSSKGDGSMMFYTSCKTNEQWGKECGIDLSDKAQVLAWFKNEFAGWDSIWWELFENAEPHFVLRPQYCMPLGLEWEPSPNITMLGDAAHLMPPFAGEGVNMAMQDALELSNCLANDSFPDTLSAIATFEKQMRTRSAEAATQTLESTAALHGPDAISYIVELIS